MYEPKPLQEDALAQFEAFFSGKNPGKTEFGLTPKEYISKQRTRAIAVLPCGTGKTLLEYWASVQQMDDLVVVFSPSQPLLSQSSRVWETQSKDENRSIRFLNIASEANVHGEITTDVDKICSFLNTKDKKIICCTYQSSQTLLEAFNKSGQKSLGVAVFDEGHRLVSKSETDKAFRNVLGFPFDKFITMTATLRDTELCDGTKFNWKLTELGEVVFAMSLSEAVSLGLLTPAEIIPVALACEDPKELLDLAAEHATAISTILDTNPEIRKLVVYHRTVEESKLFTEVLKKLNPGLSVGHVDGYPESKEASAKAYMEFQLLDRNQQRGVISNSRYFTEGIDVPDIDSVYFAVSKASYVDLTQCSGRAMRLYEGKDKCYIYVPMHNSESSIEASAKTLTKLDNILNSKEIVVSQTSYTLASTTRIFDMKSKQYISGVDNILAALPRLRKLKEERPIFEDVAKALISLEKYLGNNPFDFLTIGSNTIQHHTTTQRYSAVVKFGPILLAKSENPEYCLTISKLPKNLNQFVVLYADELKISAKTFLDGGFRRIGAESHPDVRNKLISMHSKIATTCHESAMFKAWLRNASSTEEAISRGSSWLQGEASNYFNDSPITSVEFKAILQSKEFQELNLLQKYQLFTGIGETNFQVSLAKNFASEENIDNGKRERRLRNIR